MKTTLLQLTWRLGIILALASCDPFQEDSLTPDNQITVAQTDYYILPGSSVLVDLKSIIAQSQVNAIIKISQYPEYGLVTRIDTFMFQYKSYPNFPQGVDHFSFSVASDEEIVSAININIHLISSTEDISCDQPGIFAMEDFVNLKMDTAVAIRPLDNDRFCEIERENTSLSIFLQPRNGQAKIEGDSIVYSPAPGFYGNDSLVYEVIASDNQGTEPSEIPLSSYALVKYSVRPEPAHSPDGWTVLRHVTSANDLSFASDKVGVIAGDFNTLLKTTDGGNSWKDVSISAVEGTFWGFRKVHFFDANNGYGAGVAHDDRYRILNNLVIFSTIDGGETWSPKVLDKINDSSGTPEGVYFNSMLNGFAITSDSKVHKTNDGGDSWELVSEGISPFIRAQFRFLTSSVGFAYYEDGSILKTTDGGDSWFSVDKLTQPLIIASNNNLLFGASGGSDMASIPETSLWKSEDGENWQFIWSTTVEPLNFSFSPQGSLGVIVGGHNRSIPAALITINSGATWQYQDFDNVDPYKWYTFAYGISIPSETTAFVLADDAGYPVLLKYELK